MDIRTVRHGRIKLNGRWWRPDENHRAYDGRLDGQRFLFYKYPNADLVALWGTEEVANTLGNSDGPLPNGPELVDGGYPWYFWHLEDDSA